MARCLLEFMAKDMGAEPASLLEMFQGQPQGFRMNYYPPCWQANEVLGMSPHTDAAGLTLLLQVNGMPGLQIRKDGKWFTVNALEGSLVVNVGDVLELMDAVCIEYSLAPLFDALSPICCCITDPE